MSSYQPDRTAVILVDVLNDMLAPDGKLHSQLADGLNETGAEDNILRLIQGTRAAGVPLVYAPHGINEHTFADLKYVLPRLQYAVDNKVFWTGTPGADFYPPMRPQDGDVISTRHRMFNAFAGTDLDHLLRERGIEKLVLAGFTSQTCVEGTGRAALDAGYHVTFLTDAVAEFTPQAQRAALEISYPFFGHAIRTVDAFLGELPERDR